MTLMIGPHSSNGSAMAIMPWPSAWSETYRHVGGVIQTASSTFQDVFDRRRTWRAEWTLIPSGSQSTLRTEFERDSTLDMSPPDSGSSTYYQVYIVGDFESTHVHTGTVGSPRYNVRMAFQET